jgi:hypothetical protein
LEKIVSALLCAGLEDAFRFRDRFAEQLAFVDGQRERLFAVNVLSGAECLDVDFRVLVVGGTLDDDINVLVVDDLAVVLHDNGFLRVDLLFELLGIAKIGVTDHDDITMSRGMCRNAATASADADTGNPQLV